MHREAEHDELVHHNLREMQENCDAWFKELLQILGGSVAGSRLAGAQVTAASHPNPPAQAQLGASCPSFFSQETLAPLPVPTQPSGVKTAAAARTDWPASTERNSAPTAARADEPTRPTATADKVENLGITNDRSGTRPRNKEDELGEILRKLDEDKRKEYDDIVPTAARADVPTTPSATDNDSRNIEEELGGILRKLEEDNRKEYEEIMSRIQRQSSPE
jgi:hypothetical protein